MVVKKPFTMMELMTAMAVLVIFMLALIRFFTASQDVMKRASDKTDQFERARIAMDMLAGDLQNIFYSEGVNTISYYQIDDTVDIPDVEGDSTTTVPSTTRLSIPVLRQDTPPGATSKLAYVTYKYDPTAMTLKVAVYGDDNTTYWLLDNLSTDATNLANLYPDPEDAKYETIIDGVLAFGIVPKKSKNAAGTEYEPCTVTDLYATAPADLRRIPDLVVIQMILIDKDAIDSMKSFEGDTLPATLNPRNAAFVGKQKIRSFSRTVVLDRGQL